MDVNDQGLFGVTLTKNGLKKNVIVDDYFPCLDQKPTYSVSKCDNLWVMVIEKAWAKVHKNYERMERA